MRKLVLACAMLLLTLTGVALATDNGPQASSISPPSYTCKTTFWGRACDCEGAADCLAMDRDNVCKPKLAPADDCVENECSCTWKKQSSGNAKDPAQLFAATKMQAMKMSKTPAKTAPPKKPATQMMASKFNSTATVSKLVQPTPKNAAYNCNTDGKCTCEGVAACLSMNATDSLCDKNSNNEPVLACDQGGCICNKSAPGTGTAQAAANADGVCTSQGIVIMNGRIFTCAGKLKTIGASIE